MIRKKTTIGVFIDLAKAFDTVDHQILLQKLERYGIRGVALNYFRDYLSNRQQFVTINGTSSSRTYIKCGVPQGSVLGPLLFLLYINDLNCVSSKLDNIMFADDTNLFLTGKSIVDVEEQMNQELLLVTEWFQANRLSLNITKTSYLIFSNNKNLTANIFIDKMPINQQYDTKFLGLILSSNLHWDKHIEVVAGKISKNIGIIAKLRHILPQKLICGLYQTLVNPYISYCNLVWAQPHETTILNKILRIQKKYCRIITFSKFTEHSRPLFVRLSILSVYDTYKYQLLIHVYKEVRNISPIGRKYYVENSRIHKYHTRQDSNLHLPQCRTSLKKNTISFQGPILWNALSDKIRSCKALSIFKRTLKLFLLSQ